MSFATAFQPDADPERALALREQKRQFNREYHAKRWASDPEYRAKKRAASRKQVAQPDYNSKRREARKRRSPEQLEGDTERARRWAANHYERVREGHLRRKYDITVAEVDRMLAAQGFACRLCEAPFSDRKPYNIDHCHSTGVVRGLLCVRCNTALGKFQDDAALLRKAANYVEAAR